MNAYGGVIHIFLTLTHVGSEWSAPVYIGHEVEWIPEPVWKREEKILDLTRTWNSDPSAVQPVASRYGLLQGRLYLFYLICPANYHSNNCSLIIYHPAIGGT
jgi:hypothetical protein